MRSIRDTFIIEDNDVLAKKSYWINQLDGVNVPTNLTGIPKSLQDKYLTITKVYAADSQKQKELRNYVCLSLIYAFQYYLAERDYYFIGFQENAQHIQYVKIHTNDDKNHIRKEIQDKLDYAVENYYPYKNLKEYITCAGSNYELSDVLFAWNTETADRSFPIRLIGIPDDNELILNIRYNQKIFPDNIKKFASCIDFCLKKYLGEKSDFQYPLLTPYFLKENHTDKLKSDHLFDYFEQTVQKNGAKPAIVNDHVNLTYQELYQLVINLADQLENAEISQSKICVWTPRDIPYAVSILALIKLNKTFIPIDEATPLTRVKYILSELDGAIITDTYKEGLNGCTQIVYSGKNTHFHHVSAVSEKKAPDQICYILYTSGSTGMPKGVAVKESNVINLNEWFSSKFLYTPKNVLAMTSIAFDVSIEEILLSLLNGCTVYMPDASIKLDKRLFAEYLIKNKINIVQFVPVSAKNLLLNIPFIDSLEFIICGGDILTEDLRKDILKKGYRLYNHYGPTECTVDAITTECRYIQNDKLIGRPIWNTEVYIIDKQEENVPDGLLGEIVIAGKGVTNGYFNNPELTEQHFKYVDSIGKFVYKTGDMGRYTFDHQIEFWGRIDHQIKISGHRIELDEIEKTIQSCVSVRNSVVTIEKTDNQKNIIAYAVPQNGGSATEVKRHVKKYLPHYMIPKKIYLVSKLPLTRNDKVDLNQIKKYVIDSEKNIKKKLPSSETEKKLAEICEKIMGFEIYDISSPFDDLGFSSLNLFELCCKIQDSINSNIRITQLLKWNTIEKLAAHLHIASTSPRTSNPEKHSALISLTDIQRNKKNIFLVHPGNGEIYMYMNLVKNLNNTYNYWALRFPELPRKGPGNISAETAAEIYVSEILNVQSDDFIIIGYCIGGILAYEICRQLELLGKNVIYLGLINSFAPDKKFWGNIEPFSVKSEKEEIQKFIHDVDFLNHLEYDDYHKIWEEAYSYAASKNLPVKDYVYDDMEIVIPDFNRISSDNFFKYLNRIRTLDNIRAMYDPDYRCHAPIAFFLANQETAANYKNWNLYTRAHIHTYTVTGTNSSIFLNPNIQELADAINQSLDELIRPLPAL